MNKKGLILGGTANLGFFVALGGSQGFTPQILTELPPLHTASGSCNHSVSCDAICLLPKCNVKQMLCAAEQVALWILQHGISGFILKERWLRYNESNG